MLHDLGTKWHKNDLTYEVTAYPQDGDMSPQRVDYEIQRAFEVWSAVTPLRFYRPRPGTQPDIEIRFIQPFIDHDPIDMNQFDGPSGVLAHAFQPGTHYINGDSHFDEAEVWTFDSYKGSQKEI